MSLTPSRDWTNSRLVEECLNGNQQAWRVLVDRYKNLVYSIPLRYGAQPQDAADIFQSVCLELFHELPRLREAEALQGWLIRVTANKCYHWKRLQKPAAGLDEAALDDLPESAMLPADSLAEIEREQLVRDSVRLLPARCREMIGLLFFEQPPMPYAEVAQRLHLAIGSIGFIRGRCLKRLRHLLEERGF